MREKDKLYDAKVRWQETRINQFSYVNYLILTLSLATVGFAVSLATRNNPFKPEWCTYNSYLYFLSLILFLISIGLGICCAWTRLIDFRKTAEIARLKDRFGIHAAELEIKKLQSETNKLGKRSWGFLRWQIYTFGGGLLLLSFTMGIAIWQYQIQQ